MRKALSGTLRQLSRRPVIQVPIDEKHRHVPGGSRRAFAESVYVDLPAKIVRNRRVVKRLSEKGFRRLGFGSSQAELRVRRRTRYGVCHHASRAFFEIFINGLKHRREDARIAVSERSEKSREPGIGRACCH